MEQNHLDILQKVLKLKNRYRIKADQFIEANKDANIAILIQNQQCDLYIMGSFRPLCEHLIAYIIADSVIRHNSGDWYINRCIQALLTRVKKTKRYKNNNTAFTNVPSLVQKCLKLYKESTPPIKSA